MRVIKLSAQTKPQYRPQISKMTQTNPKTTLTQKQHKHQPVFLCEIIQLCCIPLRDLRYLRENIHMRVLNLLAQRKPQCLPQISQMTQTNHKTQSSNNHNNHNNQPVFICEIMQLAAFLCVISAICGRIFT